MAADFTAEFLALDSNRGYAGANNVALERLFAAGCEHVLVLNNDTLVTPDALAALGACAERHRAAGPIGPRVARDRPGAPPASLGERYWAALAWLPRTLLRNRRARQRSYAVGGVMGCALLVSRELYAALGGFDESYFAYYDEVDYCLRARRAGRRPYVEPMAEVAHRGHRGFGGGMTPVAAYLKARNLWLLGRRHLGAPGWLVFAPGYFLMVGASMLGYLVRGRTDIVRAIARGIAAGLAGESGHPPDWVFAASGYRTALP